MTPRLCPSPLTAGLPSGRGRGVRAPRGPRFPRCAPVTLGAVSQCRVGLARVLLLRTAVGAAQPSSPVGTRAPAFAGHLQGPLKSAGGHPFILLAPHVRIGPPRARRDLSVWLVSCGSVGMAWPLAVVGTLKSGAVFLVRDLCRSQLSGDVCAVPGAQASAAQRPAE